MPGRPVQALFGRSTARWLKMPVHFGLHWNAKDTARVEKLITGALGPTASLYFQVLHVSTSL